MRDPERWVRIVSELIGVGVALAALNQVTDGEVARQGRHLLDLISSWWDRRSRLRLMLDAAAGAPETINEGERHVRGY